jgi:hypothetical protein
MRVLAYTSTNVPGIAIASRYTDFMSRLRRASHLSFSIDDAASLRLRLKPRNEKRCLFLESGIAALQHAILKAI